MDWTEHGDGTHTTPDGRYLLATRRDTRPRYARSYWVLIDTDHPDHPDHQIGGPLAGYAQLETAKAEAERRITMAQCPDHDEENTMDALPEPTNQAMAAADPDHWPVVSRMHSGEWGVHCLACSTAAGDYVPRCLVFADNWPPLVLKEAPRCDLMEAKAEAAARASQAAGEPRSTGCGSRAAHDPDRGSAGHTEPRLREIFDDAFGEAPGGWEESVDAGIAAIRAAIADEIEAEEAKIDRRSSDQASWHSNGMIAAANLIRAGGQ